MLEIPDYQTLMLPALRLAAEREVTVPGIVGELATEFDLTPDQLAQRIPSGRFPLFNNRVHWAKTYMAPTGGRETAPIPHFGEVVFFAAWRGPGTLKFFELPDLPPSRRRPQGVIYAAGNAFWKPPPVSATTATCWWRNVRTALVNGVGCNRR